MEIIRLISLFITCISKLTAQTLEAKKISISDECLHHNYEIESTFLTECLLKCQRNYLLPVFKDTRCLCIPSKCIAEKAGNIYEAFVSPDIPENKILGDSTLSKTFLKEEFTHFQNVFRYSKYTFDNFICSVYRVVLFQTKHFGMF